MKAITKILTLLIAVLANTFAFAQPGQEPVLNQSFPIFINDSITTTINVNSIAWSPNNQTLRFDDASIITSYMNSGSVSISTDGQNLYYNTNGNNVYFEVINVTICDDGNGVSIDFNCQDGSLILFASNIPYYGLIANEDNAFIQSGTTNQIIIDVKENDIYDNYDLAELTFEIVDAPNEGTAMSLGNGFIEYTPDAANSLNPVYFSYKIVDNITAAESYPAYVEIHFFDNNIVDFQALNDTFSTGLDLPIPLNILGNDSYNGFTFATIITQPNNGTVFTDYYNPYVTYIPNSSFAGVDSFEYEIFNNFNPLETTTAWVYITVSYSYFCALCVLPGDCNNSGIVNHKDLLNIGLNFNEVGPPRDYADITFLPQIGFDWILDSILFLLDPKFADANGDGLISFFDIDIINFNYGQYESITEVEIPTNVNGPTITLTPNTDTLFAGETTTFPVTFGDSNVSLQDIYGIAFTIEYDPNIISEVTFDAENSWLASLDGVISLTRTDFGKIDIAISKTDHQGAIGFGDLGDLSIIIEENLIPEIDFINTSLLSIKDVLAITSNSDTIEVNPIDKTISYSANVVGINDNIEKELIIKISPNPASDFVNLYNKSSETLHIIITNLEGKYFEQQIINPSETVNVDLQNYPQGLYNISADNNIVANFLIKK